MKIRRRSKFCRCSECLDSNILRRRQKKKKNTENISRRIGSEIRFASECLEPTLRVQEALGPKELVGQSEVPRVEEKAL